MKNFRCIHSDEERLFKMGEFYKAEETQTKTVVKIKSDAGATYTADFLPNNQGWILEADCRNRFKIGKVFIFKFQELRLNKLEKLFNKLFNERSTEVR